MRIVVDAFMGCGDRFCLLEDIIEILHQRGFYTLYQEGDSNLTNIWSQRLDISTLFRVGRQSGPYMECLHKLSHTRCGIINFWTFLFFSQRDIVPRIPTGPDTDPAIPLSALI
jgi:hypothetical protein